jgi:hypothetical protein
MKYKKSNRIQQMMYIAGSAALLSSCRPWLASHGETHSPYHPQPKPSTAQAAETNGKTPATPVTASPTVSPSPTPVIKRPFAGKSLIMSDDERLQIRFNQKWIISADLQSSIDGNSLPSFDSHGCRTLNLQQGSWRAKPDTSHFLCAVHYCVRHPGTDSDGLQLAIKASSTYLFQKTEAVEAPDDHSDVAHVTLQWDAGGSPSGRIDQMICDGKGGSLTVGDLIDAFGGDKDKDIVDISIVPAQTTSADAPASSATPIPAPARTVPAPVKRRDSAIQWSTPSERAPASTELPQQAGQPNPVANTVASNSENERGYEYEMRPSFGIQFMGSAGAFGNSMISPAQQGVKSRAFLVQLEYEPPFLQSLGVFSIGPSAGIYPTLGNTSSDEKVTSNVLSIHEFGGQVRYQFHYWNDQFLVPYVSYEVQRLSYNINQGGDGSLTIAGGSAGIGLLLNRLATGEAVDFRRSFGVSRSYLVVEGKNLSGSDQNVKVSGTSLYFGLRFER